MNPDLARDQANGIPVGANASTLSAVRSEFDDIDRARADEYALLAALLLRAPDADLLKRLSSLPATESPLGRAHGALSQAAANISADAVNREYFELFIGVGRGELLPYTSYYLTGFLNERPLARLRADMLQLGIERADDHCDPEDHLGTLCEIMSGLAGGHFETSGESEAGFFDRHLAPWSARFFADLEAAKAADFYRAVGKVGRIFIEIETEGFAMAAQ